MSSVISGVFLIATGISCLSIWLRKRLREAKEERHTLGDQPLLYVEETSSGTAPQPHQTRDEDMYAHTTSGIYNYLNLRVQLSNLSDSDNQNEIPSDCPGLSPDSISEQSQERIQTMEKESQTDLHTDSENSEDVYFDVSYAGQILVFLHKDESFQRTCSLKSDTDVDDGEYCDVNYTGQHSIVSYGSEYHNQTNSSKSELAVDNDSLAEYVNCVNISQISESVDNVYSSVQKNIKKTQFQ